MDSLRVRWVPLLQSFHRLGAFAMGPHPRVHGFPVLRLLCPFRLSPMASNFHEAFPPHYFPTALRIPRGVSRVHRGGLQRDEVGGVFKPRQHLCYVYASLSRLDFRGLLEKGIVVFEGLTGFLAVKKPTALMMH